jgi:hypothetical protein
MPYFRCYQENVHRTFVIELHDEAKIKQARAYAEGRDDSKSIAGTVVKAPRRYNRPWSWHLDPKTIEFVTNSTEVCDASVIDVERHLNEIGGDFLPRAHWCPWRSRLIEEVRFSIFGLHTL